jgi:LysR family transcriptional regulator for bpeEF and oprC
MSASGESPRRTIVFPAQVHWRLVAENQLEASLNVRPFQRTTRKVSLTAEGEAFLAKVEAILGGVAEAVTMFQAPGNAVSGRLRIDIPSAFAVEGSHRSCA